MTVITFGVLGATVVFDADGLARQLPRKTAQVMALLILGRGEFVSTDAIVATLWGDDPPSSARTMVREHVKRLRGGFDGDECDVLATARNGYVLDASVDAVDAGRFDVGLDTAAALREAGDPWGAAATLRESLALWRGTRALADVREVPALRVEAARLDERRELALLTLAECLLERGTPDTALPMLRALVTEHPDRERHWTMLMVAQCALGRRPEASESYRRARRSFRDRHGMDLSAEIDAVHNALLVGDSLEGIARPAGLTTAGARGRLVGAPS